MGKGAAGKIHKSNKEMDYLKDEEYYLDLYDLHTIEECLDHCRLIKNKISKDKDAHFAKYSQEEFDSEVRKFLGMVLYTVKGERFLQKKETLEKWMTKDRRMQDMYDNTPPPSNIRCAVCGSETRMTFKNLHDSYESTARMTFMFECIKCKKCKALYEDGTEWKHEPSKCPKCGYLLKDDLKIKGDITTFTSVCKKCGYKNKDVSDHKKWREEQEAKEKRDKEILKKFRDEFCLSDKDGQEYFEYKEAMEVATVVKEEEIQKYDNSYYPKSLKLRKLSVVELEKLLSGKLNSKNYIKLTLEKPEMGQFVVVPFTVQDSDSTRKEIYSSRELEKLIKKTLEETNWRLMSGGVNYRLGYLSGRLKGVEGEENMFQLAGKRKKVESSNVSNEKRMKYAGHSLVQLARVIGKSEGIDRVRKRRLEKEPGGFFLEPTEGPYTCAICGEYHPGNDFWWTAEGQWCRDCWRNIQEGVIPPLSYESEDKTWIKEWQLQSDFGLHSATRRKLRREGILKGRDLKRKDGIIYCAVYLVSENQEFIKRYRKNKI